jgi:HEAT repeat protein
MAMSFGRLILIGSVAIACVAGQNEEKYNSNERILRIRELGKKNAAVLPALTQYLTDPDRDIRLEAVKAIVKIDTERSLDPLIQATHDKDADVQIRATDGIVNAYLPGYVAKSGWTNSMTRGVRQMKSYFSSRNDQVIDPGVEVRADAAQAIADLVLSGATSEAQANAALAAGILRDGKAVKNLETRLHGKSADLIFECLVALQKINDPSAGPAVSFLAQDLDERIQLTALETIGVLRSESSAPNVRSALNSARNVKTRRAALSALACLGQPDDRKTFLGYANDKDVELRSSALEGLGRIREPIDFPVLDRSFDEGEIDWRIHLAAAFGMVNEGKVDDQEFSPLPYLVESLQNRSRQSMASDYLAELCSHANVTASLVRMFPRLERDQKIALCQIFGKANTAETITALKNLTHDIDPNVVYAASKALQTAQTRRPIA